MSRAVLITDLDGTFLNPSGELPANASEFLETLDELSIDFWVATSRSPQNVCELFAPLSRCYVAVCSDGAVTITAESTKFDVTDEVLLPVEVSRDIVRTMRAQSPELEIFAFSGSACGFEILHSSHERRIASLEWLMKAFLDSRPIRPLKLGQDIPDRAFESLRSLSWFAPRLILEPATRRLRLAIREHPVQLLHYPETRVPTAHAGQDMRDYSWTDVIADGVDKATAVRKMLERERSDCPIIALGNGDNDAALLTAATLSFAPSDSSESARNSASCVLERPSGEPFVGSVLSMIREELVNGNR